MVNGLGGFIVKASTVMALASSPLVFAGEENETKDKTKEILTPQIINPQTIKVPDNVLPANRHTYRCYANERAKYILTGTLKGCSIILGPVPRARGSDGEKFE